MSDKTLDVVVYGASGFTGRQAALYLAEHGGDALRWGLAGRDPYKLESVRRELGPQHAELPIFVAEAHDRRALGEMAAETKVVISTVGPFALYGDALVDACVEHGSDYADITGETPWARRLIERHHDEAARRGIKLVPFSGFDSVPSDIGTLFMVDHIRRELGQSCAEVRSLFLWRGGLNGGTFATMLHGYENEHGADLRDPLLLNPEGQRSDEERRRSKDQFGPRFDDALGTWTAPNIMAPINTRVVRRSNALAEQFGQGYGPQFTYREGYEVHLPLTRIKASTGTAALLILDLALRTSAGRKLLRRFGPEPGYGPSDAVIEGGFFRSHILGIAEDGTRRFATFAGDGDPANRITVTCLCETALALATQRDQLPGGPERGGVLTPATAIGLPLAVRLQNAGMRLAIDELGWG